MKQSLKTILLCGFLAFSLTSCEASSSQVKSNAETSDSYACWLEELKKEMITKGISKETIDSVYQKDFYKPNPKIVQVDRKQNEFILTATEYLNRVVNKTRTEKAQKNHKELKNTLKKIEKQYGVQSHYIVAFWGVETNFGSNFGGYDVIEALTTLSYDNRRPQFFREELYQALKIIDVWKIDHTKMQGSWAGAMGHFQFMPSTFNVYAVDYDKNNQIDIWHSFEDAAASASNYLSKIGWNKNLEWGMEVTLPWNFDFSVVGRNNTKTVKEWRKLGVKTIKHKDIPISLVEKVSIILPEGKKGTSYLVKQHFLKIMMWNRSDRKTFV